MSNCKAEISFVVQVTRSQRFMLPRKLQSRYRRHLAHFKLQISRARRSLNHLSRLRIHLVQEIKIGPIQSRKNVFETNIVALHDQIPQRISRPSPSFLPSRRHRSRRRDDVCIIIATQKTAPLAKKAVFFKACFVDVCVKTLRTSTKVCCELPPESIILMRKKDEQFFFCPETSDFLRGSGGAPWEKARLYCFFETEKTCLSHATALPCSPPSVSSFKRVSL